MEIDIVSHMQRFDSHGNGIIVKGRVRSGKTYLLGIMARLFIEAGFVVIGNVRFSDDMLRKYAGKLYYIVTDKDYFEAYLEVPPDTPIILMFDDSQGQQGMTSTGVMTKQGKQLASWLIVCGKLETNWVYVAHRDYIPHSITTGFDPLIIWKYERSHFWVTSKLYDTRAEVQRYGYRVPVPSPDKFKGFDIISKGTAWFEFTLDMEAMIKHLSGQHIGDNLRLGVSEFLNGKLQGDPDQHLKDLTHKDIIKAIYYKKPEVKGSDKLYKLFNREILYDTLKECQTKSKEGTK